MVGIIARVVVERGFGFIRPSEGTDKSEAFFHFSQLRGGLVFDEKLVSGGRVRRERDGQGVASGRRETAGLKTMTTPKRKWFVFSAANAESRFGFGTVDEATKFCHALNRGRFIHLFAFEEIIDREVIESLENQPRKRIERLEVVALV